MALYVDDILIISDNQDEINKTKAFLQEQFEMEDMGIVKRFLGMDIDQTPNGDIRINQKDYVKSVLDKFGMLNCRPSKTPFVAGEKLRSYEGVAEEQDRQTYQQMVGSLMYASTCTRPDIAFATSTLSRFNNNPGPQHFKAVKHVLQYLRGTIDFGISYKAGEEDDGLDFHGYTDSDWVGEEDGRRSTSGFMFLMAGGAISWRSKRQNTVATSSTEAEYVACAMASKEALWIRQLLAELQVFYNNNEYLQATNNNCEPEIPSDWYYQPKNTTLPATTIYCDNNGATALTKNPEQMKKTKHIDIAYHFVRERVQSKELDFQYIPTGDMVADGLTKYLSAEKHTGYLKSMGLDSIN